MDTIRPIKYAIELRNRKHPLCEGYAAVLELSEVYENGKAKRIRSEVLWENEDLKGNYEIVRGLVTSYLKPIFGETPEEFLRFDEVFGFAIKSKDDAQSVFNHIIEEIYVSSDKNRVIIKPILPSSDGRVIKPDIQISVKKIDPFLIIDHRKDYDAHYLANDTKEAGKIYLTILNGRFEDGYYQWMANIKDTEDDRPKFTREEIDNLPESMDELKDKLRKELVKYEESQVTKVEHLEQFKDIAMAIESKDPYLAMKILRIRKNNQYEGISILKFSQIDNEFK